MLGEFYKMKRVTNRQVASHFYVSTLQNWLVYNNYTVYEDVLKHFESLELYPVCDGIKKALVFIEFVLDKRFEECQVDSEEGLNFVLGQLEENEFEKHREISRLVYKDILTEIYAEQIRSLTKGN